MCLICACFNTPLTVNFGFWSVQAKYQNILDISLIFVQSFFCQIYFPALFWKFAPTISSFRCLCLFKQTRLTCLKSMIFPQLKLIDQNISFFSYSDCKPLWAFEDITPRNGNIKSADQLESFLQIIVSLFDEALPRSALRGRWGREALHWATSCSSRHYAGRSFQIFRSLKVPLSWPMLSDILQRLVETVADSSEDFQVCCLYSMNLFHATLRFLHLLKTSGNVWFSDFFLKYKNKPVTRNGQVLHSLTLEQRRYLKSTNCMFLTSRLQFV